MIISPGLVTLLLAQVQAPALDQPAVVKLCAADLTRRPPGVRRLDRYLDLGHLPGAEREAWRRTLDGFVNHLSRQPVIERTAAIAEGAIVRINLDDYGWRDVWEKLAEADPWYHEQAEITAAVVTRWELWPGGRWTDGRIYPRGSFQHEVKVRVKQSRATALARSVTDGEESKRALAYLVAETGSQVPIVRGDWFLWQVAIAAERTPGYYDFLGVKNAKDFELLVGHDKASVDKLGEIEQLEAVKQSGVAREPRRLGAFSTAREASEWRTFDNRLAIDKKNPLRVLDRKNFLHEAEERIGPLPNRLPAALLCDDKGKLQDSAPDFIGPDQTAHSNDGRIHVGLCWDCHSRDGGYLRKINGWVKRTYTPPPIALQAIDERERQELRALYFRNLTRRLEDSERIFARALDEANGMKPPEYGRALRKAFAAYDSPATLARIARDVGTTPERLTAAILARLKAGRYVDPLVAELTKAGTEPLGVRQYHEIIPLLFEIVRNR